MKIAKMAAALAAVTMIAAPIVASAATRAAPFRYATAVKKAHRAGAELPGVLILIPAAAVVVVATDKASKSNGA